MPRDVSYRLTANDLEDLIRSHTLGDPARYATRDPFPDTFRLGPDLGLTHEDRHRLAALLAAQYHWQTDSLRERTICSMNLTCTTFRELVEFLDNQ